jgi:hypothetical protein
MAIERQLSRNDIFNQLSGIKFNNENYAKQFYHLSEQNWFVQYGKQSKTMLAKLTAKVKNGIKQGKYGNTGLDTLDDGWKRFLKPLQGANKKQRAKSEYQEAKEETPLAEKEKPIRKQKVYTAPSGKEYTKNPATVTKREYEKEVKNEAVNYQMPDF